MVGSRSGDNLDGEASGSGSQKRLTHHLFSSGKSMAAKRTPTKAKQHSSRANVRPSQVPSMFAVATNNLVNMVAVATVSVAVLLTLLAIEHF
jgi:hypothetical protein